MTDSAHLVLRGRTAPITGVSRRRGIGYSIAVRLAGLGADPFPHHHRAHGSGQPRGADDPDGVCEGVRAALRPGADPADPEVIGRVPAATPFGRFGEPADPARPVGRLASDGGRWIVGQVITSDGGFSLGTGG